MNLPVICQPRFRFNSGAPHGPGTVSACHLAPDLVAALASSPRLADLQKSVFRVIVAEAAVMDPKSWTRKRPFLRWSAALKMEERQCHERVRITRPA